MLRKTMRGSGVWAEIFYSETLLVKAKTVKLRLSPALRRWKHINIHYESKKGSVGKPCGALKIV